jgi:hypothetical protein
MYGTTIALKEICYFQIYFICICDVHDGKTAEQQVTSHSAADNFSLALHLLLLFSYWNFWHEKLSICE